MVQFAPLHQANALAHATPIIRWILRENGVIIHKVTEGRGIVMPESGKTERIGLILGLAIQAAGIVWWASNLNSEVQHNDFQIQMMSKDVEKHAIFVRDWPSGKYGSGELPSDTKQDLFITELVKRVEKLYDELYILKATEGK